LTTIRSYARRFVIGAHRGASSGDDREATNPGAATHRGNEETVLFDIVNVERRERRIGNGGRERNRIGGNALGTRPGARLGACAREQGLFFSCYLQERESGLHPLPETRN
jgi:hypothetical protein